MFNSNNQIFGTLQKLTQAISGPLSTTAFALPSSYGINGVPAGLTFQNMLGSLSSSLSAKPEFLFPGNPNTQAFAPNQTFGGYRNIQSQSFGGIPFPQGLIPGSMPSRKSKAKAFPPGPLMPGSELIGSDFSPVQSFQQGQISPLQVLLGSQLQGQGLIGSPQFGQAGSSQGSFAGASPSYAQFPQATYPQTQSSGIGGLLGTLIFPVLTLFGAVKSLFSLRGILGGLQPAKVNPNNFQYAQYNAYTDNLQENEEGSFDDYEHYTRREGDLVEDSLALSKIGNYE